MVQLLSPLAYFGHYLTLPTSDLARRSMTLTSPQPNAFVPQTWEGGGNLKPSCSRSRRVCRAQGGQPRARLVSALMRRGERNKRAQTVPSFFSWVQPLISHNPINNKIWPLRFSSAGTGSPQRQLSPKVICQTVSTSVCVPLWAEL